jgi:hypothetical protein
VHYRVKLPKGSVGESMAVVFFNVDSSMAKGGPMNMQMRHGVSIYAMVKDTAAPDIRIKSLKTTLTGNTTSSPLSFSLTLENKDRIHVRPRNKVYLSIDGKQATEIELDYGYPLYPNSEYTYSGKTAAGGWPPGKYSAVVQTECGWTYEHGNIIEKKYDFILNGSTEVQIVR